MNERDQLKWAAILVGAMAATLAGMVLLQFILSFASAADARPGCLTKSEAHAAHPRLYISYRVRDGRRCWFAPGAKVEPPSPKMWIVEAPPWDQSVWYPPSRMGDDVIFSTFPGEPPDVWPEE